MNRTRRNVLKAGAGGSVLALLGAAGLVAPDMARAADWNKGAFEAKTVADAFRALGAGSPTESAEVVIKAPDIAENGSVVPIGVESRIQGTESIAVLIEKNPNPLTASFEIPAGTDPGISTRVKMAETSDVYALVRANGKYFVAKKEVKVTLGGCGG